MIRSLRHVTAACALLALPVLGARAQDVPRSGKAPAPDAVLPLDPAVRTGVLGNGMRYYIRRNARPAGRVELRLAVNAGSVLESDTQRGLAHFVEHMAFNGTRRFAKQALVDFLERSGMRFGAHLNAYTSFDETVYMLRVPTDRPATVDTAFMILEDWASGIAFDSAEVEKERGVVIEEWRLGQGAYERVRQQQMPVLLAGSRYAERLPIGNRETLEHFEHARLREFYQDWYRPDLMAVVVVGDVDPDAVERRIRQGFAAWKAPAQAKPRPAYTVTPRDTTVVQVATDAELTTSSVDVYQLQPQSPSVTVADYRRELVEALYNDMLNRRFAEIIQRPDAPFVSAWSAQGSMVRTSEVYILGAQAPEGGIPGALEAVIAEARRVDRHGFTPTELERVKADVLRGYEQAYAERTQQESDALAGVYVEHFLGGDSAPGIEAEYALVRSLLPTIRLDEVNTLARAWITDRGRVVLASTPQKAGVTPPAGASLVAAIARGDAAEVAAYEDAVSDEPLLAPLPSPGAIRETVVDTALGTTTWRLSNGMRVIVKPTDFKADEVLVSAFSPGGTSLVTDAEALTAGFAPFAVTAGGAGRFDAIALQKKLSGTTVDLVPYIAETMEGFAGSVSPREVEPLLQLMHLYFTAPRRDTAAYAALQRNFRTSLTDRDLSPVAAFNDTIAVTLAQHHPRRMPLTAARLDSVSLDRALAIYRERFANAGDFTVLFVGAVAPEDLRPFAERYLASLPATGTAERGRDVGVRPPAARVERIVRRGIEPQSSTAMIFTSDFDFTPENRLALGAVDAVLEIRLREQLREALGATYGVSVAASASKSPREEASVSVRFGSAPERADELVQAVLAAVDSLQRRGPTADELAKVKEAMLRDRETNLRENRYWLGQIETKLQVGEDPRSILDADARVRALTAEQVREAARRWIDPARFVRVTLLPER